MEYQSVSGLRREDFQKVVDGKQVDLFFLRNENGCEVAVTNYGGSLVAIMVPDREGRMDDMETASVVVSSISMAKSIIWPSITAPTICMVVPPVSMHAFGMLNRLMNTFLYCAMSVHIMRRDFLENSI